MDFPKLTDVQKVCHTSVQDAACSIKNIEDIDLLQRVLKYEGKHYDRATMKKMLNSRIRRLKKSKNSA